MEKKKNLSAIGVTLPSAVDMKIGIVWSEWNTEITAALLNGAIATLREAGCVDENIVVKQVPGAFELPFGVRLFAEHSDVDGVIALGCVVQGETRHFDFICQGVTQGIQSVSLDWDLPTAFGVLTTNDMQQALDRAGGKYGNKGREAAATLLRMITLQRDFESSDMDETDRLLVS